MHYCLIIIRNISILICLFPFIWGCGNGSETPSKPKVVSQKIAVKKDDELLTQKPKKVIDKAVVQPPSKEPKAVVQPPSKEPKVVVQPPPKEPKVSLTEKPKAPEKPEVKVTDVAKPPSVIPETGKAVTDKKSVAALYQTTLEKDSLEKAFSYNPIGKIDPFEPLVKEEPVAASRAMKKKKIKRRIPRTPLEKVDLSQLKLTGIIRAPSGNKAMVEEATGKGYIITKGTYIGIYSGRVIKILNDRVIVKEEIEDGFGSVTIKERELKFQKPTGE